MVVAGDVQVQSKKQGTTKAGEPTYYVELGFMGGATNVKVTPEQYASLQEAAYYSIEARLVQGWQGALAIQLVSHEGRKPRRAA